MEGDSINLSMRKALALRQAWLRGSWQAHRAVALAFSSGTTGAMSSKTNLKQERMLRLLTPENHLSSSLTLGHRFGRRPRRRQNWRERTHWRASRPIIWKFSRQFSDYLGPSVAVAVNINTTLTQHDELVP